MNTRSRRRQVGLVALLVSLPVASVQAATPDAQIGSEDERLRRQAPLEAPERVTIPIELPPEPEAPPVPDGTPIQVTRVELDGATVLTGREADALTRPIVGQTVTLQQLRELAQAVTRWYRRRGYVTSRAVVPAQTVEDGVVRLRIVEGRVGAVRVEGARYASAERLARTLGLAPGELLWLPRLESGLARLNAHPDRTVRLVMAPGAQSASTDLILQVEDRFPIHTAYTFDTLGSEVTGRLRQSVTASHRNLTGRDDMLSAMGLITEFGGLKGGALSYVLPVSPRGTALTFEVSGVKSDVGGSLKSLRAHGNAITLSPGILIPLWQRSRFNADATAGFDYRRIRTYLDDVANSKDDLRVARVGGSAMYQDRWGRSLVSPELRVGIPGVLGGSHAEDVAASRAQAAGDFVRLLMNGARAQRAPWGTILVWRGSGQMTSDRLVPAEQFRLGGVDTVRGYPEGEYLGDTGFHSSLEYRVPVGRFIPPLGEESNAIADARRSVTVLGFWDYGEGFVRHPRAGEDADMRLAGIGLGLHARPSAESLTQLDIGWPVGDDASEDGRLRVHFVVRIGF